MSLAKPGVHQAKSKGVGDGEEGHGENQKLLFSFNSLVDQTGTLLSLGHAVSGSHSQVNATLWEEVKLLSGF